jgi:hypothetical protein
MLQQINARLVRNNYEWWSKLSDGILAIAALTLLWMVVPLAARPIKTLFGLPGLLIYALGMLAISMLCLQQSIVSRHSDATRAWFGTAGGFLAWGVVAVSSYLGVPVLPSLAGILLLVMVALIVILLWRNILPVGVRFFSLGLLFNWAGQIFILIQEWLARHSPIFALSFRATAVVAAIGTISGIAWILFRSRRRLQRVSGALGIWFLVSLVIYVIQGRLY